MSGPNTGSEYVELQTVAALRETVKRQAARIEALEAALRRIRDMVFEDGSQPIRNARDFAALLAQKDCGQ